MVAWRVDYRFYWTGYVDCEPKTEEGSSTDAVWQRARFQKSAWRSRM